MKEKTIEGPRVLIKPMLAKLEYAVPKNGYACEVKWDGVRAIGYVSGGTLQLFSRNDLEISAAYPELQDLAKQLKNRDAILDGEIVALNSDGQADFELLQSRMHIRDAASARSLSQTTPVTYMLFDIVSLRGVPTIGDSYLTRRKKLLSLKLKGPYWQTPDNFQGDAQPFLEATQKAGLEGVIAKRCDSSYTPGKRSDDWLKIKHVHKQEFIIAGWQDGDGARQGVPGALLLGYFDNAIQDARRKKTPQRLVYAGKVGTGFSNKFLKEIHTQLKQRAIANNPFDVDPPRERALHFARPELVAEVRFGSWTSTHRLRHASFQGMRDDKAANEVVREV